MTQMIISCELADLTVTNRGVPICSSGWQYKEVLYPIYELDAVDTASLMGLILVFFTACYAGRRLVKFLDMAGTSD